MFCPFNSPEGFVTCCWYFICAHKAFKRKKIEFVFQKCKFEMPKFSASTVKEIDCSICNKAIPFEKDVFVTYVIYVCVYTYVYMCV